MPERYAIYYAPEQGSALDRFGSLWLGRCARTGLTVEQSIVPGIAGHELRTLTAAPRHYGFHATLVSPFTLSSSCAVDDILDRARTTAQRIAPFTLAPMAVREIGNFLALVPVRQDEVAALAEKCLRAFHALREPPSLAELEHRRSRGLTLIQERLLADWGYPYVLGEYRFHLSLTGPIRDKGRRRTLLRRIAEHTDPLCTATHQVQDICVFHQHTPEAPFLLTHRVPLGT